MIVIPPAILAFMLADFRVKLMDYAKLRADAAEFCRYCSRWLGMLLMERLKAEVNEVFEEAITWWECRRSRIGGDHEW